MRGKKHEAIISKLPIIIRYIWPSLWESKLKKQKSFLMRFIFSMLLFQGNGVFCPLGISIKPNYYGLSIDLMEQNISLRGKTEKELGEHI